MAITKELKDMKNFLQNRDGWELDELISEITYETDMLNIKDIKGIAADECGIVWGDPKDGDELCVLSDFIYSFTNIFIDKICNVIDSYDGYDVEDENEEE